MLAYQTPSAFHLLTLLEWKMVLFDHDHQCPQNDTGVTISPQTLYLDLPGIIMVTGIHRSFHFRTESTREVTRSQTMRFLPGTAQRSWQSLPPQSPRHKDTSGSRSIDGGCTLTRLVTSRPLSTHCPVGTHPQAPGWLPASYSNQTSPVTKLQGKTSGPRGSASQAHLHH